MSWSEWVNGIAGLWTMVAAYLYVPSGAGRAVVFITGLVVAILGFWGGATEPHYSSTSGRQIQH